MADRLARGTRVRARAGDVPHHTRLPRYASGAIGTIVEFEGTFPLADDLARGLPTTHRSVYTVEFDARELFGEGDHRVTLDLWSDYLVPLEGDRREL